MTDPTPLGDQTPDGQRSDSQKSDDKSFQGRLKKWGLTTNRLVLWVLVGGFGLYLLITGIVGVITKAR
ncbi:MAG TPA: hypothetical protein VIJ76_08255 [Galbitalea sp.]